MNHLYANLFQSAHREDLLKQADAGLLSRIRSEGITIWCLEDYTDAHTVILQGNRSSVAVMTDGSLPANTIIVNHRQVRFYADRCDMPLFTCLTVALAHEWQHLSLMKAEGLDESCSEVRVWDEVAKLRLCSDADLENLRNFALLQKNPDLSAREFDSSPQFWRDFLRLGSQTGYKMGWQAVQGDINKLGLKPWELLRVLQEDCRLDYDIACPLSGMFEDDNIDYALLMLAVRRKDYVELNRIVKPKPAVRHIPEQPMPGDVIPPRSLRR